MGHANKTEFLPVNIAVLTISDTRTKADDTSGDTLAERIRAAGHKLIKRDIVTDDKPAIEAKLKAWIADPAIDVVITTGGTGVTGRDVTPEALAAVSEKEIPGFGELFRMLSYEAVGSAAMLSRACAGSIAHTAVFSLPGAEQAVRLAMEKLILPEVGHVVRELTR